MRIVVVHSFYRAALPSGENDVVAAQVALLRDSGHDVMLWSRTSPDENSAAAKVAMGCQVAINGGAEPRRAIEDFQPEFVHVHNTFPNISMSWMKSCSIPTAMTLHNYRTVCANGVLSRDSAPCTKCLSGNRSAAVRHGCYRGSRIATLPVLGFQGHLRKVIKHDVDLLVFPSQMAADILGPRLPHQTSIVLPNYVPDIGVRDSRLANPESDYFVVVGRLTPEKGVDQLLRMWPRNRRLIVAGEGPQRPELESIASGKDVKLVGFVAADRRDPLIQQARGLILPSVTLEADPVVVAQALSAGTPCVTWAETSTARLASESPAILTYDSQDSLVVALDALAKDGPRSAARALYETRWSAAAWLRNYRVGVVSRLLPHGYPGADDTWGPVHA